LELNDKVQIALTLIKILPNRRTEKLQPLHMVKPTKTLNRRQVFVDQGYHGCASTEAHYEFVTLFYFVKYDRV
jgi:hypothetical protein